MAGGRTEDVAARDAGEVDGQERKMSLAMPAHTFHVVQAFEQRDGGIVPLESKACPSAGSARALAARLAPTTSVSSPGQERASMRRIRGRRRGSAISPCPSARVLCVRSRRPPRRNARSASAAAVRTGATKR
jgi:hypothetical protein